MKKLLQSITIALIALMILLPLTPAQADAADAPWRNLAYWLAALAFLGASGHLLVVDALRHV